MKTVLLAGGGSLMEHFITFCLKEKKLNFLFFILDKRPPCIKLSKNVVYIPIDLSKKEEVRNVKRVMKNEFNVEKIDYLILNSAIADSSIFFKEETYDFREIIDCNLVSYLNVLQVFYNSLKDFFSKVLVISSISAIKPFIHHPVYASTKNALVSISENLIKDSSFKARVYCLLPTYMYSKPVLEAIKFSEEYNQIVEDYGFISIEFYLNTLLEFMIEEEKEEGIYILEKGNKLSVLERFS